MIQMIIEIDSLAEFSQMPAELQKAIEKAGIVWDLNILSGTQPINGKKLILVLSKVDAETLNNWMNNSYPSGDFIDDQEVMFNFDLGWAILAVEDEKVDQSALLPYFINEPVFDEAGEVIGSIPVSDLTDRLPIWAGHNWTY